MFDAQGAPRQARSGIHPLGPHFRVRKRVNGRLVQRVFDTLTEAESFLARLEQSIRDHVAIENDRLLRGQTVGDVVREWWEGPSDVPVELRRGHRDRVSPRTRGDYQYLIDRHISKIADRPMGAFSEQPGLLKAYYDSFTARVSVWRVHAILRQAFDYAVVQRWIDVNPAALKPYHPARVKRRRKTKLVPSREHVEKLIAAAYEEDETWGFFVYTLATLGLRCGEACALHWESFDFDTREVDILWAVSTPKSGARELGQMFLKEPKAGEGRTLPVGAEYFERAGLLRKNSGLVFPNPHARSDVETEIPAYGLRPAGLWHPNEATRRFRAMRKRSDLPPYTPHSLRHFVATQALIKMQGRSLNQVAEFLGHSPRMTLELYGWTLDRDALKRVGETVVTLLNVEGSWQRAEERGELDGPRSEP
jgi:integrase